MSKTKNIIQKVDKREMYEQQLRKEYYKVADKYNEREEIEKEKDENTKRHERYRRRQLQTGGADVSGLIKPTQIKEQKPGTYFYGTLEKIGKDFNGELEKMVKYFTLGQNSKYYPNKEENKIYSSKTGDLLYDCNTKTFYKN